MKNKKHILLFSLAVDSADPLLGFAVSLIGRIAAEAEYVHVITVRKGAYRLPENVRVYSIGREQGNGKLYGLFLFYRHLFAALRTNRITFCFAHMNALFALLAAPVLVMRGIPLVLWYSHRHRGLIVRLAGFFAARIVTSTKGSYTSHNAKVVITGQIIDTDLFIPADKLARAVPPLFISAGRIAPIKDALTFVRAAAAMRDAGHACAYRFVGPVLSHDKGYYSAVCAEIRRLSLEDRFSFSHAVPYAKMPAEYRRAFAHVNACPDGSLDKAALEAMACGVPSVFANRSFVSVAGLFTPKLLFRHGDANGLARVLIGLLDMSSASLDAMRAGMREAAVRGHNADSFVRRLMELPV